MSQSTPQGNINGQAHGLDLVREVLFGADKRHTSEEFAMLKTQLSDLAQKLASDMAQFEKTMTARAEQFATQTDARFKQMDALVSDNAKRGADALANARAAIEAQHQAHLKALADERAAFESRQSAFIAHLRNAIDALGAQPRSK
jgi:DNA anti-recombination protein RmuC